MKLLNEKRRTKVCQIKKGGFKMKKEIMILLCVCALSLQLGGCLSQGDTKSAAQSSSTETGSSVLNGSRSIAVEDSASTSSDGIIITDGAFRIRHHGHVTDGAIITDGAIRPERPTCRGITVTDGAIKPKHHGEEKKHGHHGETTPGAITTTGAITTDGAINP